MNDTMSPIQLVLSRLDRVSSTGRDKWKACCPAHSDKTPSLSVCQTDDGRVLLNCFAGCAVDDILAAIGLTTAELFPPRGDIGDYAPRRKQWKRDNSINKELLHSAHILGIACTDLLMGRQLSDADFLNVVNTINNLKLLENTNEL